MNQKTLFKLEYDKIIALLEKEATSFRGGQLCRRLKPMTDINKINTFQEQTAAWSFSFPYHIAPVMSRRISL